MSKSVVSFITFGLVLIALFFTWQLILHKQLEKRPLECIGEKYANNSCVMGNACVIPGQNASSSLFSIPTSSDQAVRIINEFKNQENPTGYCIPWVSLVLNMPIKSEQVVK